MSRQGCCPEVFESLMMWFDLRQLMINPGKSLMVRPLMAEHELCQAIFAGQVKFAPLPDVFRECPDFKKRL